MIITFADKKAVDCGRRKRAETRTNFYNLNGNFQSTAIMRKSSLSFTEMAQLLIQVCSTRKTNSNEKKKHIKNSVRESPENQRRRQKNNLKILIVFFTAAGSNALPLL